MRPEREQLDAGPGLEAEGASAAPDAASAVAFGSMQALAGADLATRGAMVARLQQGAGNASVARAAAAVTAPSRAAGAPTVGTRVERYPFHARIRRVAAAAPAPGHIAAPAARMDAGPGEEHGHELKALFESLGGEASAAPAAPAAGAAAAPASGGTAPAAGAAPPASGAAAAPPAPAPAGAAPGAGAEGATPEGDGAPTRTKVPDIVIPALAKAGKSDVEAAFKYTGSIT